MKKMGRGVLKGDDPMEEIKQKGNKQIKNGKERRKRNMWTKEQPHL